MRKWLWVTFTIIYFGQIFSSTNSSPSYIVTIKYTVPLKISGLCSVMYRLKKNGNFVVEFMQKGSGRFSCRVIYSESMNISSTQNLYRSLGFISVILNSFIYNRR